MSYEVVNVRDTRYGRTPLLEACLMNRLRVVNALVNSKLQAGTIMCYEENCDSRSILFF